LPLLLGAALVTAALALPAAAAAGNPWLSMRVLNQAHQGGEDVNPSNTMYAYGAALADGSDMLELDVHSTSDHQIVVTHDETVDRTTNGTGAIRDMTLAQVQALDAAYWFVPGRSAVHGLDPSAYTLRGVRSGQRPPPPGYDANDFRVPTLKEVLDAYPHIPINVEIKGGDNAEKYQVADDLAALLRGYPRQDIIVVSFEQSAIDRFHAESPNTPIAAGTTAAASFLLLGQPLPPGTDALQLPYEFTTDSIGIHLGLNYPIPLARRWVTQKAHAEGVAVHYWEVPENQEAYDQVLGVCGDGVMTTQPARFEGALEQAGAPRVGGQGGTDSCPNPPPPPPPGCRLTFAKLLAPVDGKIAVRFERWGDLRGNCTARLTVRTIKRMRLPAAKKGKKGRRSRLKLGAADFTAPAGRSGATAWVALNRNARRLLKRHRWVPTTVELQGTATDAAPALTLAGR
jgi:glycerophosphoryl diester phosphodiesterase